MEGSEEDKMRRDTKISIVKAVVGIASWLVALQLSVVVYVGMMVILGLYFRTFHRTTGEQATMTVLHRRMGKFKTSLFLVFTNTVAATALWYVLNWLF